MGEVAENANKVLRNIIHCLRIETEFYGSYLKLLTSVARTEWIPLGLADQCF